MTEVSTDTVTLTLSAEQEGADPDAISTALSRRADDMVNQAERTSDVQAETGGFNIYPNTDRSDEISVWCGRVGVRIMSEGFMAASKLADQLANQTWVQNVNFTLPCETHATTEARPVDQAVNPFRNKALTVTKLFGYASYTIYDVHVSEGSNSPGPRPMVHMAAAPVSFDSASMPIEGGRAQVTVTVFGAVQMLK